MPHSDGQGMDDRLLSASLLAWIASIEIWLDKTWTAMQEHFHQTPTSELPQLLADVDKERPIMMYCTGGIRCDIYSTILRQKGYNNLYSLEGGVAKYLREKGSDHWEGSLFTFDDRIAIAPGELPSISTAEDEI